MADASAAIVPIGRQLFVSAFVFRLDLLLLGQQTGFKLNGSRPRVMRR